MNAEHDALCEFLQWNPARIKLILEPRYTFKSSIATIAHSLWLLLCDPNHRSLIYSDATDKAQGFLGDIKAHIMGETSSNFRLMLGSRWDVNPKRRTWNQESITIAQRNVDTKPSIETAGIETSKTGKHYDRLKFDDIVSDKNVTTKELMDKVVDCYKNSLLLMKRSGNVDLVGTRWHYGDLYGRLIAEHRDNPEFALFHRKAHEGTRYFFADIGKESLTPERCAQLHRELASYKYSCLIQNTPTDNETAIFKKDDFRFYQPELITDYPLWLSGLYITCVLDAIPPPTSDHGDDAAITVVGTDHVHNMYILDVVLGRLHPDEQIDKLLTLHSKWHFRKVGIETNAFQKMLSVALQDKLRKLREDPGWRPFSLVEFKGSTQGNKELRIMALQPYHESHTLYFPGKEFELLRGNFATLAYQMIEFPNSRKDDALDSLAYNLQLKHQGEKIEAQKVYPRTSAAWFEREQRRKKLVEIERQPRWEREELPSLTFS